MKVSRGDVVLVDYPFTDRTGSKVRPTLVVSTDEFLAPSPLSPAIRGGFYSINSAFFLPSRRRHGIITVSNIRPRFSRLEQRGPGAGLPQALASCRTTHYETLSHLRGILLVRSVAGPAGVFAMLRAR